MALSYRPFAETPVAEKISQGIENAVPEISMLRRFGMTPGAALALGGLAAIALSRKGFLKWALLIGGYLFWRQNRAR
jgi:hypothetical protein